MWIGDWDRHEERIKEGTTVHSRRKIVVTPDTNSMGVTMRVHQSAIRYIANGQKARIRVDAFPNRLSRVLGVGGSSSRMIRLTSSRLELCSRCLSKGVVPVSS